MKNKIYLFIYLFYFIDLFTDARVGNKNIDLIYFFNYIEKICERVIK